MELMREVGVIDAETDRPMLGSVADTNQSVVLQQLLHATDDLAALDKLDEVGSGGGFRLWAEALPMKMCKVK